MAFAAALHWDIGGDVELEFEKLGLSGRKFYHVFDFWNELYVGDFEGGFTCLRGEAHSLNLFVIRPVVEGKPSLIGDTTHAVSSVEAKYDRQTLELSWDCHADHSDSAETFFVQNGKEPVIGGSINCHVDSIEKIQAGAWKIHLTARTGRCGFTVS
jgi:hypothetical protein